MSEKKRVLSVFSLVMINVIAVDSLRTLSLTAKLGTHLVFYYFVAAIMFFVPVALVAAELATAYPQTGGIYVWVREAFGRQAAFVTIWLQWIYNVVWYPTIMAFIAVTIAYLFDESLAYQKIYLVVSTIGLFWFFTLLNCFGMKTSSIISTIGASIGTLLPMCVVITLGGIWIYLGYPTEITPEASWLPNLNSLDTLPLFSIVLFGLLGIEMSAVHAEEVKNPQRDYPLALLYSTIIIFLTLVLGALAIVIVLPNSQLSIVGGLIDALSFFFNAFHVTWLLPLTALCIVIGSLSSVSAWIIGPAKGLLIAAEDGCIPTAFTRTNRHGAPVIVLIAQAIIFTLLTVVYALFNSINAAYWVLSDLSAQLALIVYVVMFAAAIRLRYKNPEHAGAYKIPGGKPVIWLVAGSGFLCCLLTILIGFIPPKEIPISNVYCFEAFLFGGLFIFLVLPWLFSRK